MFIYVNLYVLCRKSLINEIKLLSKKINKKYKNFKIFILLTKKYEEK